MNAQSYLVALQEQTEPDYRAMARIVGKETDKPQFALMKQLRECGGIIAENLSPERAERLVAQLNASSMASFSAPQSELAAMPGAFKVKEASATDKEIVVKGTPANGSGLRAGTIKIPWKRIVLLAAARVRGEEEYRTTDTVIEYRPPIFHYGGAVTPGRHYRRVERANKKRSKWEYFLDAVVDDPLLDIRFGATEFRYASLGIPLLRSSFENLCTLIKYMCLNCREGVADRSVQLVLDGNPLTRLDSRSNQAYANYLRWKLLLRKRRR